MKSAIKPAYRLNRGPAILSSGEATAISEAFLDLMRSHGTAEPDEDTLGDAIALAGVLKYPARIKCALLGWMAWKQATTRALGQRD